MSCHNSPSMVLSASCCPAQSATWQGTGWHLTLVVLVCACAACVAGCVLQLQFNMRGPGGIAIVNADMFKDGSGSWDYMYLIVDVKSGQSPVQRLNIVAPKLVPAA